MTAASEPRRRNRVVQPSPSATGAGVRTAAQKASVPGAPGSPNPANGSSPANSMKVSLWSAKPED